MSVLVGDIGGTHARFAIAEPGQTALEPQVLMTAGLERFEDALIMFLESAGIKAFELEGAIISAAGPLREDGSIHMTNGPWDLAPEQIKGAHPFPFVRLLNDMSAAVRALPALGAQDLDQIGGTTPQVGGTKTLLSPGTGLGIASLAFADGNETPIASEGGHASLAPANERELAIVFHLQRQFGHVAQEYILSGSGLELLYTTLGALDGTAAPPLSPVDIAAAARRGEAQAVECYQIFSGWLGAAAGDAALMVFASGGVYMGGGVLPRLGDLFDRAAFRRRFEAKGDLSGFVKDVPVYVVSRQDLGLLGCVRAAEQSLG